MRGDLDDPEFVISDGGAEFGSQAGESAPLWIGQQMTGLNDGDRDDADEGIQAGEVGRVGREPTNPPIFGSGLIGDQRLLGQPT
jgi:hypothetical protein